MDDLTFTTMLNVLLSGMWLLNDLESYLRPFNMSQARLSILLAVVESPDGVVSPKEAAAVTGKSFPAITRTIDKLSDDGLISVRRDGSDGRRKRLALTYEGKATLDRIIPGYNRRVLEMSSALSPEDMETMNSLLRKINFLDEDRVLR